MYYRTLWYEQESGIFISSADLKACGPGGAHPKFRYVPRQSEKWGLRIEFERENAGLRSELERENAGLQNGL